MAIYLFGSPDEGDIDFKCSHQFLQDIHEEESDHKQLLIYMQSPGGEWGDGMSIYDSILFSNLSSTIIGFGYLCSMSTVILQAANNRFLMPNCDLIVHFGSLTLDGHQVAVESANKYYTKIKNRMIDIYTDKCINGEFFQERNYSRSKTKAYIKRKLESNVDWYLNAEEAVYYGFADKILSKEEYVSIKKRDTRRDK